MHISTFGLRGLSQAVEVEVAPGPGFPPSARAHEFAACLTKRNQARALWPLIILVIFGDNFQYLPVLKCSGRPIEPILDKTPQSCFRTMTSLVGGVRGCQEVLHAPRFPASGGKRLSPVQPRGRRPIEFDFDGVRAL